MFTRAGATVGKMLENRDLVGKCDVHTFFVDNKVLGSAIFIGLVHTNPVQEIRNPERRINPDFTLKYGIFEPKNTHLCWKLAQNLIIWYFFILFLSKCTIGKLSRNLP